jgi:hypothetical protein
MRNLAASLLLVAMSTMAVGQTASPVTSGGIIDKAVNQPGIGWEMYGDSQRAKQVPAADVPGGNAVRVQISKKGEHPWDAGATYPTIKPIANGDTVLVMVYLRAPDMQGTETAPVTVAAGAAEAPYASFASETVQVGAGWKRYFAAGTAAQDFAPGKARIALQLAGAKQVIEMGPAFLLDFGKNFDKAKLPHN